jgi:hypothetical protein
MPVIARAAALVLLAVAGAACASAPLAGASRPTASTLAGQSGSPVAAALPSGKPGSSSASPVASATQSGTSASSSAWGVLVRLGSDSYDVSLVAVDGTPARNAHAARRAPITVPSPSGPQTALDLPYVSATRTTVYYLDGDTQVRSLVPGQADQKLVTTIPGSATAHAGFSVSPDDSRIAVSVIDYGGSQPALRLLVGPLGGQLNQIFASTSDFVWPVGWHSGAIVLATQNGPPFVDTRLQLNPYGALAYHLADPSNANRLGVIGHPEDSIGCWPPSGLLTVAGTACYLSAFNGQTGAYAILNWQGNRYFEPRPASWDAAASVAPEPSATSVIVCCQGDSDYGQFVLSGPDGSSVTPLRGRRSDWACWIDGSHIMSGSSDSAGSSGAVFDVSTGGVATTGEIGICAAVLPTDLG